MFVTDAMQMGILKAARQQIQCNFANTLALSTAAAAAAAPWDSSCLQGCTRNANFPVPMSMFTAVFGSRCGLKAVIFASPVLCQMHAEQSLVTDLTLQAVLAFRVSI